MHAPEPDAALYGRDATPGLLDVQPLRDADAATARLYLRDADGHVAVREEAFFPFFFLSDAALLRGFPRDRYRVQRLRGDAFFRFAVAFARMGDYHDALRHVERAVEARDRRPDEIYRVGSPAMQYLMQTGRTCFKGMDFDALHRLQLDIEVASDAGFPNAERPEDAVIIVALSDNRGWQRLLHSRDGSEEALLRETLAAIAARDPDVIEGHNIYSFDLAYLETRCARYGLPFALGRDGSAPRAFPASMRFAERSVEYPAYEIAGRHVVDTMFLAMQYDVFKRDLTGYGLKAVARYFGFAPEGRTYVEGGEIARVWREDPDRLLAYALDDVTETERIARHLSGASFYLTQMLPMPYGQVARTGPAAKIEALFVREYLRRRHAIPKPQWGSQTTGGYTDVFVTGVVGPIAYADVESLYPSIMLTQGVQPASDTLGLFPTLLRRLTDLRLETKRAARAADTPDERSSLDARQSAYKVLINSFYGSLGFGFAAFNDFAEADRVAATGQELLKVVITEVRRQGGTVVEVDTDGILFVPPPEVESEAEEKAFVARLNDVLPEGIRIAYEGRAAKMLSYKKKNYALLGYDGRIKFKGSSLVSRSTERFGRAFVREAVRLLLAEDVAALHALYNRTREAILRRDWPHGVDDFSRTETLKDTVEAYRRDVEAGKRARAASYELAIAQAETTGVPVRVGDRVTYYVTGTAPGVTTYDNARLAAQWRADAPDENTAFYLKRLDEFARKFDAFFSETDFRQVFSPPDLFGFDASGIRLVQHMRETGEADEEVPF
jgi:DNA polymerase, archaea type